MSDSFTIDVTQTTGALAEKTSVTANPAPTPATTSSTSDVLPFPSPSEHLDAALGIEVMQYLNQNGTVSQSFPSQRQLDAYRDGASVENQVDQNLQGRTTKIA